MNLAKALSSIGKNAISATGIPYLINTDIVNPIKSITGQLSGNRQAMNNAESAFNQPLTNQLKQWGGNSASALLPFAGGAAFARMPAGSLAERAMSGGAIGGLLGGAMNVTGTLGQGADPTLGTFGQGALFGGALGAASPLAGALVQNLHPLDEFGRISIRNPEGHWFEGKLPVNNIDGHTYGPQQLSGAAHQSFLSKQGGIRPYDALQSRIESAHQSGNIVLRDRLLNQLPPDVRAGMGFDSSLKPVVDPITHKITMQKR